MMTSTLEQTRPGSAQTPGLKPSTWSSLPLSSWLGPPWQSKDRISSGLSAESAAAALEQLRQHGFICFRNDVEVACETFQNVQTSLEAFFRAGSLQKQRFSLQRRDGALMQRTCGYHVDRLYQRECLRVIELHGEELERAYTTLAAKADEAQVAEGGGAGLGSPVPQGLVVELRAAAALLRSLCLEVLRAIRAEAAGEVLDEHLRSGDPSVVDAFRYSGGDDAALYMSGHCDPGIFTVHPVVGVPGLQMAERLGSAGCGHEAWLDVEAGCSEGDLILWAGERLPQLTGGMDLRPTRHRVRCSRLGPRVSLTFELKDHASNYRLELLPKAVVSSVAQLAGLLPAEAAEQHVERPAES